MSTEVDVHGDSRGAEVLEDEVENAAEQSQAVEEGQKDELEKFIQNIKLKQTGAKAVDSPAGQIPAVGGALSSAGPLTAAPAVFTVDYKPQSTCKQHVYSVNELLKLQNKGTPLAADILASLPKKSFWRLTGRGHHEGRNSHGGNNKEGAPHDKKSSRHRNSRNGARRNNQHNNVRNNTHDLSKEVSRDELLAMEEELQPTGNSMADFEKWRAQVKVLERKKKGLLPIENKPEDKTKPSSSLSEFFNFKREGVPAAPLEELEPSESRFATPKGSSSRFSSFFSNASMSSNNGAQEANKAVPAAPAPEATQQTGGFRLMSLFNKEEKSPGSSSQPPATPATGTPTTQEAGTSQQPFVIHSNKLTDQSNQFLQSLMTKGKSTTIRQEPTGQSGSPHSNPQQQYLEKMSTSGKQQANAPPGLSKNSNSPPTVTAVPPPGFPMHFAHPHMIPPINNQIAMPPPAFQNFAIAPPPGVFTNAGMNADQGQPSLSQMQQPPHQQSQQQQQPHPHSHASQQSQPSQSSQQISQQPQQQAQHRNVIPSKRPQQGALPQFINGPGNMMPMQPMQGGQNQFSRQPPAGFAPYGQKIIPQPHGGFPPYGQAMMPQPPANFIPYGQKMSQTPMPGFNPYGQPIAPQLPQQKK
ncbi:AFR423Cp [Eremothecium gossypii ATCC 10895]|uniref:AFR423Cp n=1 Tax=Eremothecium gossypii (strain ATCC 10895 / CBS 109.51 / FGSC 9923 / NRRL Y-1056) TaxID=284811 RepID=Q753A1_EREGS|nr:AFR423Cp [Eremothecium gossypii ATCC 10895]AAS53794.2 AFR423Cp [Eremothecium gossypii ATCC 10895]AEY98106.1 FAFR423Cp [Eremothecium gossypii FDAG1]